MSTGRIKAYVGEPSAVRPYRETTVLRPDPVHPGWVNFAAQGSARAVAVDPASGAVCVATWGGVLAWRRKEEPFYRRYAGEHGLAGNAVACLCPDRDGRVWAGHDEGGLSYFDGERWHVHDHLRDEPVRALCAAGAGGVWAATADGVYHVPGPDTAPTPVSKGHDGAVEARALLGEDDGVLVGNDWGLFRLRPGHEPLPLEAQTIRPCTALARDSQGVWAATPSEVYCLRADGLQGPFGPAEGEDAGRIVGLAPGREGLWVLTSAGLARLAGGRWQPVHGPAGTGGAVQLRALAARPEDGYAWVGTDERLALVRADGPGRGWETDLLPAHPEDALNNLGRCVAAAGDGRTCVGTAGGLAVFGPGEGLTVDGGAGDVRSLCGPAAGAGAGDVYLLAWPRGVGRLAGAGRVEFDARQPEGTPLVLAWGPDGRPHVLTTRALWRLEPDGWRPIAEGNALACGLVAGPDGAWWLGTDRGVYRLTGSGAWQLAGEQPGPLQAEVHGLTVAGDTLWAATAAGLWARREGAWGSHLAGPDPEAGPVRAVTPAGSAGELWVACRDRLVRYDPAARALRTSYTPVNSGLAGVRITALAESAGALWVVTRAGITRLALGGGTGR